MLIRARTCKQIQPPVSRVYFSPDASYLLVGCLGGLGRSLTRWMMQHGARHFVFLSRSDIDRPEAARFVQDIEDAGASTKVFRVDAADTAAVREVVETVNAARLIRGAVHAAMVLQDGMFESMSHANFAAAVIPKAQGALSLSAALANNDLDFFVLTSSVSALLGNTGQSNYATANSVLDALARQQPAFRSVVLPMVLDVGVVSENDAIEVSLARKGLYGVDETEMLHGLEVAMRVPNTTTDKSPKSRSLVVMGMESRELVQCRALAQRDVDPYWSQDARFSHVVAAMDALNVSNGLKSGASGEDMDLRANVAAVVQAGDLEAGLLLIAQHIASKVSSILMISQSDIELDGPSLSSYGLDSMVGAEMRTWLFKEFGLDYLFQTLLATTLTFMGLARVVANHTGMLPA
jgi:KR domain